VLDKFRHSRNIAALVSFLRANRLLRILQLLTPDSDAFLFLNFLHANRILRILQLLNSCNS
jgi:hypothetical protein